MIMKSILIILTLIFAIALLAALGLARAGRENSRIVESRILSAAPVLIDLRPQVYRDLPDPVRRYFDYAFNGQDSISLRAVDWQQTGEFELPVVGRFHADGRQISRPNTPVYAFTGWFWRFGLPLIESRDAFFLDDHDMRAKFLGWKTVMHTQYDRPEQVSSLHSYLVLRYYGQAPSMPWALLPNDFVTWEARDADTATLRLTYGDLDGRYLVRFGAEGEITAMEGDRLLMEGNETMQREVGQKRDYHEINGFKVPTRMDYFWYDENGDLISFFRSQISQLRYF